MSGNYDQIEEAILQRIKDKYSDVVDAQNCIRTDFDNWFKQMQADDATVGVLLEMLGGESLDKAATNSNSWVWTISGHFFVRFRGDPAAVNNTAKLIVPRIRDTFKGYHTLGGLVSKIKVQSVQKPVEITINDVPFLVVEFVMQTMEPD
jgi:hypothetical protein